MSLLGEVVAHLREAGIPHCLIGAAALAAHGIPRSTFDLDLLTTDRAVLRPGFWAPLSRAANTVDVRPGEPDDPLAGVVRLSAPGERAVDIVVGRAGWQGAIVERAPEIVLPDAALRIAEPADLILLKLFAGGIQDLWDARQLLATAGAEVERQVEEHIAELPAACLAAWTQVRSGGDDR